MIDWRIFVYLFLLALIPLSAKALPPPSPAGGNYLVLDGVDDYAVLDFETFGYLLPDGTEEFTFEAWIYPTTPPDNKETVLVILHQQVDMVILKDGDNWANALNIEPPKGDLILLMSSYIEGGLGRTISFPISLVPNQWHHIAYQLNGNQITMIVNDFVATNQHGIPLGHDRDPRGLRPKDFVLGGYGKIIVLPGRPPAKAFLSSFTGYIDEVRISTEARYDVKKKGFMPDDKFKDDAKTAALWHFDEPGGTQQFSDASGNANHLIGKNGAKIGNALAVEAEGKLATTWGRLKR
ncbi:MAG: LamG domain-containing protein [Candidatus Poribacteria bacterium]|nr:LamG domain-containing protein [Candidatus Poribacteria bacterium]